LFAKRSVLVEGCESFVNEVFEADRVVFQESGDGFGLGFANLGLGIGVHGGPLFGGDSLLAGEESVVGGNEFLVS
jgi:hypothetical protein